MCVFRERLSVCVQASFPFGFESGVWDLIVSITDYCLSFYITMLKIYARISAQVTFVNFRTKVVGGSLQIHLFIGLHELCTLH